MASLIRKRSIAYNLMVVLVALVVLGEWQAKMASAQVNANSEQCKEERRLGINACKAVLSGQSPSAACCQRARVTNFGCVCPVTTLRLFSLVGGVGRVKQLVEGCGRRVPSRLQCGQMCHCACWKMLRPEVFKAFRIY
ncbi:hypothetical protein LguiA_017705 [Lonicera macranthoides]